MAEDDFGNVATGFAGDVSVALAKQSQRPVLVGTLTAPAVAGVAVFSGLTLDQVGTGYTLNATSNLLTPVSTDAIDVSAVNVATELSVTTQPPSQIAAGSNFSLVIQAVDALGHFDTSLRAT